jgi:hypothetical protein
MTPHTAHRPGSSRRTALVAFTVAVLAQVAACATAPAPPAPTPAAMTRSAAPPSPDPRVGLGAGWLDAAQASWNLHLVSSTPPPEGFVGVTNSDLAFTGNWAIQGNYDGFQIWDVSNAAHPTLKKAYVCPASQSDVSVYKNLLFVSGEGLSGRLDCGAGGVPDTVSQERLRGIRIFDLSDVTNPRYIANVQTCRGSHTHTVVNDPKDPDDVYIYVSGSASVRSARELPGCSGLAPDEDPNSALFRIEVIQVPLAAPQEAHIVSSPRIFEGLNAPPKHAELPADTVGRRRRPGPPPVPTGPTQCHDITVYPDVGFAGGACGGYGLLLDISDVAHPRRVYAAADSNFSFWHSATFSNDGSKLLFTDEWGGGGQPRCRVTDKPEWGADAIFTRTAAGLDFESYFKMPAAQTTFENCVAHNGSLIPIPGREVMVQAWYQGGIDVFDWTDPRRPVEIAYFDRGPMDSTRLVLAGSWSAYWYNGYIYSSEIARGLDVFELTPSPWLSQNEIDAARTVRFDYFNTQQQRRMVWPPSYALARAYLDQLERSGGLASDRIEAARAGLAAAEHMPAPKRGDVLTGLAGQLDADARGGRDRAKVGLLSGVVRELAGMR